MGDLPVADFEHENVSSLMNELHWEFSLKVNATYVAYPSPSEPVYNFAEEPCIVSVSLDGIIIAVEWEIPVVGNNTNTDTTTDDGTMSRIPIEWALVGIGSAAAVIMIAAIWKEK